MQQQDLLVYTKCDILLAIDSLFSSELLSLCQQAVSQPLEQPV